MNRDEPRDVLGQAKQRLNFADVLRSAGLLDGIDFCRIGLIDRMSHSFRPNS
jgi:hypothetical protein